MKRKRNILDLFRTRGCLVLFLLVILVIGTIITGTIMYQMSIQKKTFSKNFHLEINSISVDDNMCAYSQMAHFPNGSVDFRGFNNYTGYPNGCYVVPNIIHIIKFNEFEFTFIQMICIASILTNHNPRLLILHTNMEFKGKYWEAIQRLPGFDKVRVQYLAKPRSIFGLSLNGKYGIWHSSDVARLRLIHTYGGIYLDNDVYVVQSLDRYRRFEFALEWNYHMNLGNQILIGHRDARVIPLWLDTYKEYNASLWYYNGGVLPTKAVLEHKPELIHRVRDKFGTDTQMIFYLYLNNDTSWQWQEYDVIHLFIRYQGFEFNESSVFRYPHTVIKDMILRFLPDYMFPTSEELRRINNR
ncbi:uncharacterized protein LOC103512653 isoform X1 [Diaphorina citri]|uniref:Uncharacterized protein LOC103512653 isoform X1 n=1 Tax=Diaphorina citri TaxID=121845 RepID=A0A1S3D6T5_DIACI|nr:uncharacterized protein LOC103512653 isoform X1 [Diaphorina citri]